MRTSALAVDHIHGVDTTVDQIRPAYLEALGMIERLHRRLLDLIKAELDRHGRDDVTSTQALFLYNIGAREVTASELRAHGYYLGSNASYNLKKLTEDGFLESERSTRDRRSVRIRISDKGRVVSALVEHLYHGHVQSIAQDTSDAREFAILNRALHRLERFWTDQIIHRL